MGYVGWNDVKSAMRYINESEVLQWESTDSTPNADASNYLRGAIVVPFQPDFRRAVIYPPVTNLFFADRVADHPGHQGS